MPDERPESANGGEHLPEIRAYFQFLAPDSEVEEIDGAPQWLKDEGNGVIVPLRHDFPVEGPNPVEGYTIVSYMPTKVENAVIIYKSDMADALRKASKPEAAKWWEQNLDNSLSPLFATPTYNGRILRKENKEQFFPD